MTDQPIYDRVMGRPAPDATTPAAEIVASSGQFASAILHRLGTAMLGTDQMARSLAITEAIKLDPLHRSRDLLRRELKEFLDGTVQTQDVALPVWLNLTGYCALGVRMAIRFAATYHLDTIETGRAILVGLDMQRTETLCHIASVTGRDAFRLVCNAVQIEADRIAVVDQGKRVGS